MERKKVVELLCLIGKRIERNGNDSKPAILGVRVRVTARNTTTEAAEMVKEFTRGAAYF